MSSKIKKFDINGLSIDFDFASIEEQIQDVGEFVMDDEYIRVYVDSENRILFGIKSDGSVEWSKGVPTPIKDYIESHNAYQEELLELINTLSLDVSVLSDNIKDIDDTFDISHSIEYINVLVDSNDRIIEATTIDGKKIFAKQALFDKIYSNDYNELTLDSEDKVISYRDNKGIKYEHRMIIDNGLTLGNNAMSDLLKSLKQSGFNTTTPIDWSEETEIKLPIPRYCAKVNIITSSGLATTKTQNKKCKLQYWDKSGNYFQKYIILNALGSSSMAYIEKNQSIDIYNDEAYDESCDITFGNWVPQDSFHLKCYYIDVFRGICNVCYNYCEEVIKYTNSRNNRVIFDNSSITKINSTGEFDVDFGDGALCHPDGFPFELYVNGEYYGLYVWNIKKHRKNYSMTKKDATKTLLDGVIDGTTFFGGNIDWTQFELRNPKDLVCIDGTEYDADTNCKELIDETSEFYDDSDSVHVNTSTIKKLVVRLSEAIGLIKEESDVTAARTLYEQYYDVSAMMCFFIISNVLYHYDGFRKNWIWTIYGNITAPTFYDMDTVFGRDWKGVTVLSNSVNTILGNTSSIPTGQLVRLYKTELDEMYKSLRDDKMIDVDYIMSFVYDWMNRVGTDAYKKNIDKWPSIPSYRTERTVNDGTYDGGMFDSPRRIELWLIERIAYLDTYFNYNK